MGYPLRSNIFRSGTEEQRYFKRFPLQVAVLFSPKDSEFFDAFRNLFMDLDRLTDEHVVFFAVLDPPDEWVQSARTRTWWNEYEQRIGKIGFSVDKSSLVREIARLFGVSWDYLPAIVISPNLWLGEYIVSRTTAFHIQSQLQTLTNLVKEWGQPNPGQIIQKLRNELGFGVSYHPADNDLRSRLDSFYGFLDSAQPDQFLEQRFSLNLETQARVVENSLNQLRTQFRGDRLNLDTTPLETISPVSDASLDKAIEDVAGRLVAPATVAEKVFRRVQNEQSIIDVLDDASIAMIDTGLSIGNLIEIMNQQENSRIPTFRLRHWVERKGRFDDFTPGAQGVWKAFEREVNLSVIQAARQAKTITMPEFFSLYETGKDGKVNTGRRTVDINQEDWDAKELFKIDGRQRFISLGDAWHVRRVLSGTASMPFEMIIRKILGHPLPQKLIDDWENIFRIRNVGSHSSPINAGQYQSLLEKALDADNLRSLMAIKRYLSGRP